MRKTEFTTTKTTFPSSGLHPSPKRRNLHLVLAKKVRLTTSFEVRSRLHQRNRHFPRSLPPRSIPLSRLFPSITCTASFTYGPVTPSMYFLPHSATPPLGTLKKSSKRPREFPSRPPFLVLLRPPPQEEDPQAPSSSGTPFGANPPGPGSPPASVSAARQGSMSTKKPFVVRALSAADYGLYSVIKPQDCTADFLWTERLLPSLSYLDPADLGRIQCVQNFVVNNFSETEFLGVKICIFFSFVPLNVSYIYI